MPKRGHLYFGLTGDEIADLPRHTFATGDVVRLKSGGQKMTVCGACDALLNSGIWVVCQWFGERGMLLHEMFHESMLAKVEFE